MKVVSVRGLRFTYPDGTEALTGVDFEAKEGETVALLGSNGSGKTTFVLHLNGLLKGEGDIEIDGMLLTQQNLKAVRSKVGIVFQDSDNQLFLPTVLEDISFGPANQGLSADRAEEMAHRAMAETAITDLAHKAPFHLSAGQKKRAAIAGILAMNPRILILDEPTTFLDPPSRKSLVKLLHDLPQTKILVTHDIPFAAELATRAVFFERGRIAAEGSVGEVAGRFGWLD
jgi:cobalt/nickel transport system ATP-binding protein